MTELERENYCKDCSRSIYGNNLFKCDTNIENNGKYNGSGKCYNKCKAESEDSQCDDCEYDYDPRSGECYDCVKGKEEPYKAESEE